MCIAIASNSVVEYHDSLEEAWLNNPHGAGLAFLTGENKIKIVKGLMTLKALKGAVEKYKESLDGHPHLVHLRVTTSGGTTKSNTHPWRVSPRFAMIHNGILSYRSTPKMSDTGMFTKEVLKPLLTKKPLSIHKPWFRAFLESYLGKRNAMAFLDSVRREVVVFKEEGRGGEGCRSESGATWFSNQSHLPQNWSAYRRRNESKILTSGTPNSSGEWKRNDNGTWSQGDDYYYDQDYNSTGRRYPAIETLFIHLSKDLGRLGYVDIDNAETALRWYAKGVTTAFVSKYTFNGWARRLAYDLTLRDKLSTIVSDLEIPGRRLVPLLGDGWRITWQGLVAYFALGGKDVVRNKDIVINRMGEVFNSLNKEK